MINHAAQKMYLNKRNSLNDLANKKIILPLQPKIELKLFINSKRFKIRS